MRYEFGIVLLMFAENKDQPFLAMIFKRLDFVDNFFITQRFPDGVLIRRTEPAVGAVVRAFVADVQWREQYNPVSINLFFQFPCAVFDLFNVLRLIRVK